VEESELRVLPDLEGRRRDLHRRREDLSLAEEEEGSHLLAGLPRSVLVRAPLVEGAFGAHAARGTLAANEVERDAVRGRAAARHLDSRLPVGTRGVLAEDDAAELLLRLVAGLELPLGRAARADVRAREVEGVHGLAFEGVT